LDDLEISRYSITEVKQYYKECFRRYQIKTEKKTYTNDCIIIYSGLRINSSNDVILDITKIYLAYICRLKNNRNMYKILTIGLSITVI